MSKTIYRMLKEQSEKMMFDSPWEAYHYWNRFINRWDTAVQLNRSLELPNNYNFINQFITDNLSYHDLRLSGVGYVDHEEQRIKESYKTLTALDQKYKKPLDSLPTVPNLSSDDDKVTEKESTMDRIEELLNELSSLLHDQILCDEEFHQSVFDLVDENNPQSIPLTNKHKAIVLCMKQLSNVGKTLLETIDD